MPKVVDHDQRRAELIAAAWTVIADEGIEAATIRRIAEIAGCTTGRVTHYFEAKNEILVAALRRVHYAAGARMLGHLQTKQGTDALRAVLLDALPLDSQRALEWRVWLASSAWCVGDWLAYGQEAYVGRYREAIERTGLE